MKELKPFSIPIRGIGDRMHQFDFQVDDKFFAHYEDSLVKEGKFDITLHLDKRPDMLIFLFEVNGAFQTACDRCLAKINMPVLGTYEIIAKYSENEDGGEIIHIHPLAQEINVARFIYEAVCLTVPIVKIYDCEAEENPPCDFDSLEYLEIAEEETEVEENPNTSLGDALKGLGDIKLD